MSDPSTTLPTIPHAGVLEDLATMPAYVMPDHHGGHPANGRFSCCFCGVGDSGTVMVNETKRGAEQAPSLPAGEGLLRVKGQAEPRPAMVTDDGRLWVRTPSALTPAGGVLSGELDLEGKRSPVTVREVERKLTEGGKLFSQVFVPYRRSLSVTNSQVVDTMPTKGCVKLKHATMRQRPAFPVHVAPSVRQIGHRRSMNYSQGVAWLADLVLDHRAHRGKILLYCTGQLDYLAIFAIQEVFRLLGVRNLTGNAEHCLNAGASHNELLTGQEGPFLTIEQAIDGPGERLFLFNGWNGFITHPPAFLQVLKRDPLDVYMVEVMVTESVKMVAKKVGPERILLIKPGSDPHLALAVAHEILTHHTAGLEPRFIERFADAASFERYRALALEPHFAPEVVARRIAAEPAYEANLLAGIRGIAARMATPGVVPINIPSVGLSQTTGVVAHCLWGNAMAMVGKYGLRPDGTPAGGTLRIPGQINAESEIQGLSGKYFMGRIPIAEHAEAARRMGLPADAYAAVATDPHRAALDYCEDEGGQRELFICFGTQFEANMMNRPKWLAKLSDPNTTLVVVDPIPDPYTLRNAELVLPSPPHPATTKVYQNGEWKLSLSVPQKLAPPQTRSDATIVYDLMAEIVERLTRDEMLRRAHPDLARHLASGYLRRRFCAPPKDTPLDTTAGLVRLDGEVSRPQLWQRVLDYLGGATEAGSSGATAAGDDQLGPLYCLPTHADGRLVQWADLIENAGVIYGGVGTTRYMLDYDDPQAVPFRDIYRRPGCYRFFVPTELDLEVPEGIVLNSGRSTLSDDKELVRFASTTFNSGKATPTVGMPDTNPLYMSPLVAARLQLRTGDDARIINRETGDSIVLPVVVSDRVKGQVLYTSFHKTTAQVERGLTVNTVTSHRGRCPYSNQTKLKTTAVTVERVQPFRAVTEFDEDGPTLVRPRNVRIELDLGDADARTLAPR
jgi:anaerobic selenocysteine-containing dehydrogenase